MVKKLNQVWCSGFFGLFLVISSVSSIAKDNADLAKQLSAQGEILPLAEIIKQAQRYKKGEVIEVEFERKKKRYVYEVELLDAQGLVWEVKLDAKTGALIKLELDD